LPALRFEAFDAILCRLLTIGDMSPVSFLQAGGRRFETCTAHQVNQRVFEIAESGVTPELTPIDPWGPKSPDNSGQLSYTGICGHPHPIALFHLFLYRARAEIYLRRRAAIYGIGNYAWGSVSVAKSNPRAPRLYAHIIALSWAGRRCFEFDTDDVLVQRYLDTGRTDANIRHHSRDNHGRGATKPKRPRAKLIVILRSSRPKNRTGSLL